MSSGGRSPPTLDAFDPNDGAARPAWRRRRHDAAAPRRTPSRRSVPRARPPSQSHTAGRNTGPPGSEPWPRPWMTSTTRAPRARPAARNVSRSRRAVARTRPCRSMRPSTSRSPARSDRISLAATSGARPTIESPARSTMNVVGGRLGGAARRRGRPPRWCRHAPVPGRQRPRAAHGLLEGAVVVVARGHAPWILAPDRVGRRRALPVGAHRGRVWETSEGSQLGQARQSLRNVSTSWLMTLPFGSLRPRS